MTILARPRRLAAVLVLSFVTATGVTAVVSTPAQAADYTWCYNEVYISKNYSWKRKQLGYLNSSGAGWVKHGIAHKHINWFQPWKPSRVWWHHEEQWHYCPGGSGTFTYSYAYH